MANNPNILDTPSITTGSGEIVITEHSSGAAGTYSRSITVPGGATITEMLVTAVVGFNDDSRRGLLNIGDGDDPNGFLEDASMNALLGTAPVTSLDVLLDNAYLGAYIHVGEGSGRGEREHLYSATDHVITAILTSNGLLGNSAPFLGEARILVTWAKPTPVAATFLAA